MKIKRVLSFAIICVICFTSLFAVNQKYFSVSSDEWMSVDYLCRIKGVLGPSSIGPVSSGALKIALDRIDVKSLSPSELDFYNRCLSFLGSDNEILDFDGGFASVDIPLTYEMYLQTADTGLIFYDNDWVIHDYSDRKGIMDPTLEVGVADTVYGKIILPWIPMYKFSDFNKNFADNISPYKSIQVPFEAGMNIGNDNLSLIIARDEMSYGNGYTGNLFISNNFDYQEFIKFSFSNRYYEGTLSLTYFDQQLDQNPLKKIYNKEKDKIEWITNPDYVNSIDGLNNSTYFMSHRFSGPHQIRIATTHTANLFDKFSATLMLGAMIQSDSAFDFRMLNPFMYFHNMGNFSHETIFEANNFTSLNIVYDFLPHWSLSGQLVIDQFQLGSEVNDFGEAGYLEPNAYGALLNVSYSDIVDNGIFNVYMEGAYTSPALYINEKYINDQGDIISRRDFPDVMGSVPTGYYPTWNQDLIVGYYRPFWNAEMQAVGAGYGDISYTGYQYGPDTAVVSLGFSYDITDLVDVSGSILYKAHGEKGIPYYDNQDMTFEGLLNENFNKLSFVDEITEHSLEMKVEADWNLYDGISLYTGLGYVHRWNYRNVLDAEFDDLQCAIGFTIRPVEFGMSFFR